LLLLGEDGDSFVTGGTADGFPVFGYVVKPAFADTFRRLQTAAALFAASLPSGAVESPPSSYYALEVAPEAAAVFLSDPSFLDAGSRPYSEVDSFGSHFCPVGQTS